ncbi:hypothetical protein [Lysinibacillus fusiformis]
MISANELAFSSIYASNYELYRVYEYNMNLILANSLE